MICSILQRKPKSRRVGKYYRTMIRHPVPTPGNPVAPSAAVGDRPGCELLRTPRTFPKWVILLGVNQIKSKALARNSGVFITAAAASVAPVIFIFFNPFPAYITYNGSQRSSEHRRRRGLVCRSRESHYEPNWTRTLSDTSQRERPRSSRKSSLQLTEYAGSRFISCCMTEYRVLTQVSGPPNRAP